MKNARTTKITRGDERAALADDYRSRVEELAKMLRPRFETSELYGYGVNEDEDGDLDRHPADVLEAELKASIPDFATAYIILACSPSEDTDVDGGVELASAKSAAAECLVIDVFRFARERGWWKPQAGEWIGQSEWQALRDARSVA